MRTKRSHRSALFGLAALAVLLGTVGGAIAANQGDTTKNAAIRAVASGVTTSTASSRGTSSSSTAPVTTISKAIAVVPASTATTAATTTAAATTTTKAARAATSTSTTARANGNNTASTTTVAKTTTTTDPNRTRSTTATGSGSAGGNNTASTTTTTVAKTVSGGTVYAGSATDAACTKAGKMCVAVDRIQVVGTTWPWDIVRRLLTAKNGKTPTTAQVSAGVTDLEQANPTAFARGLQLNDILVVPASIKPWMVVDAPRL